MKSYFFWNQWPTPYRISYRIFLILLGLSILLYTVAYVVGSAFVIDWEVINTIKPVSTLLMTYDIGLFSFPVHVDNFLIFQSFHGSDLRIETWPSIILLIWIGVFISFALATITDLPRFWFLVAIILFTLLLVGLGIDHIVLFGRYDKTGIGIAILMYFPALYYFHFIKKNVPFARRLIAHGLATALFALVIYQYSGVDLPFQHLATYGIYAPLILTILFTFMVGHEIVSGLLRLISGSTLVGENRSLIHFLFISIIFLANVALLLLKNTRTLDLGAYLIGAFLLLTVAAVIGIWGYKSREVIYGGMYAFFPHGAFLYILLAITAHLTVAFFFISGNDFFIEVVEDAVVFSQLSYGLLFVVYFLANFFDLLRQNINISPVLYKPGRMPYFIFRFAGTIAILGLFFRFSMTPYYQAVAGFYSGVGDLYIQLNDDAAAKEYYKLSNVYSFTSHRANYVLAGVERAEGNRDAEIGHLKQAIDKNPTEFAYINLAERYKNDNRPFEALFTLQDGLMRFSESGVLMNNLGLIYTDLEQVDSAFYFLNMAGGYRHSKKQAETNLYAMLRIRDLSIRSDTLNHLLTTTAHLPAINNLIVLSNEKEQAVTDLGQMRFGTLEDTGIDQIVYNYNKTLNNTALIDSKYDWQMRNFYDSAGTSWFEDRNNLALALAWYRQGKMTRAFNALNLLAAQNPEAAYFSLLGKLSIDQKAFALGVDYLKKSFQAGHPEVATELAFGYMETGELDKAAFIWRQIVQTEDSASQKIGWQMLNAIEAKSMDEILYADTETRYAFIAYRGREFGTEQLEALVYSLENDDIKALSILRLLDIYMELNQKSGALAALEKMGDLNISSERILKMANLSQCRYAWHFSDKEVMAWIVGNLKETDPEIKSYKLVFSQLLKNNNSEGIEALEMLAFDNPFFEPGVLEAVHLLNAKAEQKDRAYDILLNAVNVNPFNVRLNQAYALQCIRAGLRSYAMDAREELRQTLNSVAFRTFDEKFNEVLTDYENQYEAW